MIIVSLVIFTPTVGFAQSIDLATFTRAENMGNPMSNIFLNTSLSKEALGNLFDEQVQTLVNRGYPRLANQTKAEFVNNLLGLRKLLLQVQITPHVFKESYIPFLIVIPDTIVTMPEQLRIAFRLKKPLSVKVGSKIVNAGAIWTATEPYLLLNINWERITQGYPPQNVMKDMKKGKLRPLTVEESIALIVHHQDIFETYNIAALGSRFPGNDYGFPILVNANVLFNREFKRRGVLTSITRDGSGGFIAAQTDLATIAPTTMTINY